MILSVSNLTKSYKSLKAVDDLSLDIQKGEVLGLLGPNGSGKTTTLGMLTGAILSDSGSYKWFGGISKSEAGKRIGTLLESPSFYPDLSAIENLKVIAKIKDAKTDLLNLLRTVKLYDRRTSRFDTFSLGMKQRLAIAAALIGEPEVLILDEPTNGLDPQGIVEIRQIIIDIAHSGKTILLASHILDEVEKVCSHVAIIKEGKLLIRGSVDEIIKRKNTVEVGANDLKILEKILNACDLIETIRKISGGFSLVLKEGVEPSTVNRYCFDNGIVLSNILERTRSLEEEFLEITKEGR